VDQHDLNACCTLKRTVLKLWRLGMRHAQNNGVAVRPVIKAERINT